MFDIEEVLKDLEKQTENGLEFFKTELQGLHTGRASTNLLDRITVNAYGGTSPLQELATVSILDSQTISVKVWDRNVASAVEKAILSAELDLTPIRDGELIRIPITPMTKDKREKLVKVVHSKADQCKISLRNTRRNTIDKIKKEQKSFSKDDLETYLEKVEKLIKKYMEIIDEYTNKKTEIILK